MLEIGSWQGLSTICLASVAQRVISLDRFTGDKDTGRQDTYPAFDANLKRYGLRNKVAVMMGDVEDFVDVLGGRVGMVFVDGSHDDRSVYRDSLLAIRLTRPGDVIAWHDWRMPSVQNGIEQACDCRPGVIEDNLLIWER